MKNLLRKAEREIKSLQKKQSGFNGAYTLDIYLDWSLSDDEPGKRTLITTIHNVPKRTYQAIMNKFNGGF